MPLGIIIFIFLLITCVITIFLTISFFINPHEKKLAIIRPMSRSILYASLLGLCTGIAITFKTADTGPGGIESIDLPPFFQNGITESLVPPIIGFAILSIVWLLVAAGQRKSQ